MTAKTSGRNESEMTMRLHLVLMIGLSVATPAIAKEVGCAPIHALISRINASKQARLINRWINDGFNNFGTEEVIVTEWARYSRWESGPWSVNKREFTPVDAASNCAHLRNEIVNGTSTSLYIYDLREYEAKLQVRTWIVKETGLPLQSQFITVDPKNFEERHTTYSFDAAIRAPM
jgi:hypothetical protein